MTRPRPPSSGFSLPEMLITVVILGVIAAIGTDSLVNLARRERANYVTTELTGWLDQVSRDASRFNAQAGGALCTVTISTGTVAVGAQLARIEPAACASQNIPRCRTSTPTTPAPLSPAPHPSLCSPHAAPSPPPPTPLFPTARC